MEGWIESPGGNGALTTAGVAVGAGLSCASLFTINAWVSLTSMWVAAALTDRLLEGRPRGVLDQPVPGSAGGLGATTGTG